MNKTKGVLLRIDQYPSRKEWEISSWRRIVKSKNLLELLVTSYERHNLVLRAAVRDRILSGKSYRQIADELWLSSQTISGIKKAMQRDSYRSYRERGKTERKKKVFTPLHHPTLRPYGRPVRTKYGTVYLP